VFSAVERKPGSPCSVPLLLITVAQVSWVALCYVANTLQNAHVAGKESCSMLDVQPFSLHSALRAKATYITAWHKPHMLVSADVLDDKDTYKD
jgi:hypothetical protein